MGASAGKWAERSVCEATDPLSVFQFMLWVVLGIADRGISCSSLIMDEDGVGIRVRLEAEGEPSAPECSLLGDAGVGSLSSLVGYRTPGNVRSSSEI